MAFRKRGRAFERDGSSLATRNATATVVIGLGKVVKKGEDVERQRETYSCVIPSCIIPVPWITCPSKEQNKALWQYKKVCSS